MELLAGEGDGGFKEHCACPNEGNCLQKVNQQVRDWARTNTKIVGHVSETKHQRPKAVVCHFGWWVLGVFFAGAVSAPTNLKIARTPGEVLNTIEDDRGDQKERRDANAEYFDVLFKVLQLSLPLVLR